MKTLVLNFIRDEEGASAIEYALIAGLIAVAAASVLPGVGTAVKNIFTEISKSLGGAGG